jgi:lipopolysaccharide export LptBFGC system permease protein LptF
MKTKLENKKIEIGFNKFHIIFDKFIDIVDNLHDDKLNGIFEIIENNKNYSKIENFSNSKKEVYKFYLNELNKLENNMWKFYNICGAIYNDEIS